MFEKDGGNADSHIAKAPALPRDGHAVVVYPGRTPENFKLIVEARFQQLVEIVTNGKRGARRMLIRIDNDARADIVIVIVGDGSVVDDI